jgi:hypothetical protein
VEKIIKNKTLFDFMARNVQEEKKRDQVGKGERMSFASMFSCRYGRNCIKPSCLISGHVGKIANIITSTLYTPVCEY